MATMRIDKKLLPIKGHFFLFNAGTAPLVPYLSTYARQLGFSSTTVGLIYTVLPIFGLVAKPLFGVIADRFKIQKLLFLMFQIVTILSFSSIYGIPENRLPLSVELDCGDGATVIRSRFQTPDHIDQCKVKSLGSIKELASCDMNCDMLSPKMWQTACEHWHIPQYCYSNIPTIRYHANITKVYVQNKCVYFPTNSVILDDLSFTPRCRIGGGYVDINVPCLLICKNPKIADAILTRLVQMTCVDEMLSFKLCTLDLNPWIELAKRNESSECKIACYLENATPWKLMEICEGWQADEAATCQPKSMEGRHFPDNLTFTGYVSTESTIVDHDIVYMQLKYLMLRDGIQHYPTCIAKAQYQMEAELFHSACDIKCNNSMVNEIFQTAIDSTTKEQYTSQFWLFFLFMIISWIGQAVVVTFADAICFNLLESEPSQYGKQRLWGSVGWGLFSLLTGALIDLYSDGAHKNYAVAFILMFVFMLGDVIVSCFVKVESTKISMNILADVSTFVSSLPTVVFMSWTIVVGMCTGLLWQFLFWHIEDLAGHTCDGTDHVKTLQGLVSAVQTFCGEIPFMFLSGYILKKLGHVHMMSLVLFAFGLRFVLYSFLSNPWWVLPIEMLQGITFGMFYPTMTSYANIVSPPGTETTVQGLVGAVFEGVGTSLGSFIGGRLYETYGGSNTFLWFGYASLAFCALHIILQHLLKNRTRLTGLNQGYTSVIKYEQPNDMVHILEDIAPATDK